MSLYNHFLCKKIVNNRIISFCPSYFWLQLLFPPKNNYLSVSTDAEVDSLAVSNDESPTSRDELDGRVSPPSITSSISIPRLKLGERLETDIRDWNRLLDHGTIELFTIKLNIWRIVVSEI